MEEISGPELVSKGVGEGPPVPLEGTQSPDLYTSSCLSPVLEQDFTKLWHPSPGLPANRGARGGLQSQVTGFVREKNWSKIFVANFTTKFSFFKKPQTATEKSPNTKKIPPPKKYYF